MEDIRTYTSVAKDLASYSEKVKEHFEVPEANEDGEVPQAEALATEMPDMMADSKVLSWAGIGFGEQETYRLQKSLKKFATAKPYKSIRFFGKILGTEKDYYIIECEGDVEDDGAGEEAEAGEDVEPDAKLEGKGVGVNAFQYWVSQDSLSEWTRLPELSYKDLNAARQIKVLFSGDLERKIHTNPFFFG